MLQQFGDTFNQLLGLETEVLSIWQMACRAAIIYVAGLAMVRFGGDRRFSGRHAAMDVLLGVILGSTLSRAINGSAPFFATIVATVVLVSLHRLFAIAAFHFPAFDTFIKGQSRVLIQDGQLRYPILQRSHITPSDLQSTLRLNSQCTSPSQVSIARLERSGQISIVPQSQPPQVIDVAVEDGVKTIRIQLNS